MKIVELFEAIQPIKRKYPMVFSYLKHLQKQLETGADDDDVNHHHRIDQQMIEVEKFKLFLLKNKDVVEKRTLSDWYYDGTMKTSQICFENVLIIGHPQLIETFWNKIIDIAITLFPNGIESELAKIHEQQLVVASGGGGSISGISGSGSSSSSIGGDILDSLIGSNPLLSEYMGDIQKLVNNIQTNGGNMSTVFATKEFQNLVKKLTAKLTRELKGGRMTISDLTKTIQNLMKAISKQNVSASSSSSSSSSSNDDVAAAAAAESPLPNIEPCVDAVTQALTGLDEGNTPTPETVSNIFGLLESLNIMPGLTDSFDTIMPGLKDSFKNSLE